MVAAPKGYAIRKTNSGTIKLLMSRRIPELDSLTWFSQTCSMVSLEYSIRCYLKPFDADSCAMVHVGFNSLMEMYYNVIGPVQGRFG